MLLAVGRPSGWSFAATNESVGASSSDRPAGRDGRVRVAQGNSTARVVLAQARGRPAIYHGSVMSSDDWGTNVRSPA